MEVRKASWRRRPSRQKQQLQQSLLAEAWCLGQSRCHHWLLALMNDNSKVPPLSTPSALIVGLTHSHVVPGVLKLLNNRLWLDPVTIFHGWC